MLPFLSISSGAPTEHVGWCVRCIPLKKDHAGGTRDTFQCCPCCPVPQYLDPMVVASALPGPASSSRSVFSFPARTLPVNPPGCLPVWLPYLWISLAQSPGHWASFSSPPQPRPLSQLLPSLESARSAPFRSFPPQLFFSPPLHSTGIRRQGGEEGLGQW